MSFAGLAEAINVGFDGEPIAVGDTTTLGERLITTVDYLPAPDPLMVLVFALSFAEQIAQYGDPAKVTHVVLRRLSEPTEDPKGAYITFDAIPTVGEVQDQGLSNDEIDERVNAITYIRIQ